jgi:uncharacterized RmlC-like cupin family protein
MIDAIVFVCSGVGFLLTAPSGADERPAVRHSLIAGDFVCVPAWTEHQGLNESDIDDLVWVVIQSGPRPIEVVLADWGGARIKDPKPPAPPVP